MSRVLVTAPTVTLVSADDLATHLRVTDMAAEGDYLAELARSVQDTIEADTGLALTACAWRTSLWSFAGDRADLQRWSHVPGTNVVALTAADGTKPIILLPHPVTSVTSIRYTDEAGVEQTLDPSQYVVDLDAKPVVVVPAYGCTWPTVRVGPGAVKITTANGWTDPLLVPAKVRQAFLVLAGHWYENREAVVTGTISTEVDQTYRSLIWREKVWIL